MSSLVKIGPVVLEKTQTCVWLNFVQNLTMIREKTIFSILSMYCCHFIIISSWNGLALHVNKLNSLHPRMFCAKFTSYCPSGSWEEEFFISLIFFANTLLCHFWKKSWPLIWAKLKILLSKDALCPVWKVNIHWDGGWTPGDQGSSLEFSAQMS